MGRRWAAAAKGDDDNTSFFLEATAPPSSHSISSVTLDRNISAKTFSKATAYYTPCSLGCVVCCLPASDSTVLSPGTCMIIIIIITEKKSFASAAELNRARVLYAWLHGMQASTGGEEYLRRDSDEGSCCWARDKVQRGDEQGRKVPVIRKELSTIYIRCPTPFRFVHPCPLVPCVHTYWAFRRGNGVENRCFNFTPTPLTNCNRSK